MRNVLERKEATVEGLKDRPRNSKNSSADLKKKVENWMFAETSHQWGTEEEGRGIIWDERKNWGGVQKKWPPAFPNLGGGKRKEASKRK